MRELKWYVVMDPSSTLSAVLNPPKEGHFFHRTSEEDAIRGYCLYHEHELKGADQPIKLVVFPIGTPTFYNARETIEVKKAAQRKTVQRKTA